MSSGSEDRTNGANSAQVDDAQPLDHGEKRELFKEELQEPTTLLPFAVAAMALLVLLGLAPFRFSPLLVALLLAGASIVGLISLRSGYNERIKLAIDARERALEEERARQRRIREEAETQRKRDAIQAGFLAIADDAGLMAFHNLDREWEQISQILAQPAESVVESIAGIADVVEQTYQQGLGVLLKALDLSRAFEASQEQRVRNELAQFERDVERIRDLGPEREIELLVERITGHRDRLARLDTLRIHLNELLHQASRCEDALALARIEVAAIRAGSSTSSVNAVTQSLQRTIDQAKVVQAELQRLGF